MPLMPIPPIPMKCTRCEGAKRMWPGTNIEMILRLCPAGRARCARGGYFVTRVPLTWGFGGTGVRTLYGRGRVLRGAIECAATRPV